MRIPSIILILLSVGWSTAFPCATADLLASGPPAIDSNIILTRPEMQYSWATPDGLFRIHYDTEGPMAVFHPDEDVNPVDGIPDYVNRCGDFMQIAHHVIVENLDFDPPPTDEDQGGDFRYDIYLTLVPALTTPESPSDQYPGRPAYSSYIQLGHDMRIPRYPDNPYPFLKVSAAHEYFHAVEFAYRAYSNDSTLWWFESCAVWAEDVVFDDVDDAYFRLADYMESLHKSLYMTPGSFIYGAWLYPEFVSEQMGSWIIKRCWEKFASFDFAVDAIIMAFNEYDIDFNYEYCRHIIWNYFTDYNYRPGFYQEGSRFGQTVLVSAVHSDYPVSWTGQPVEQQNVSGAYIEFLRPDISRGSLVLGYTNPTEDLQYLGIAAIRSNGEVDYEIHRIEHSISPSFYIRNFAECDKVVMMPVWAYEGIPVGGTTAYSYRAYIDSTSTSIASDTEMPVRFELTGAYPNPFNRSVSISFNSPLDEEFSITVYDILGRTVFDKNGRSITGRNSVRLDMPDELAGGTLFYVIRQDQCKLGGKILYLK